jgi:hypothetical protein
VLYQLSYVGKASTLAVSGLCAFRRGPPATHA